MSTPKDPRKPKKTKKPLQTIKREPVIWPPEEWPEEARQAEIAAWDEFMDAWCKFAQLSTPLLPTAKIILFPEQDAGDRATGFERPGYGVRATEPRGSSDRATGFERPDGPAEASQDIEK